MLFLKLWFEVGEFDKLDMNEAHWRRESEIPIDE